MNETLLKEESRYLEMHESILLKGIINAKYSLTCDEVDKQNNKSVI
jgi:hypothetical protein